MKIKKFIKAALAVAGMGVAYIAAGKLGDKAKDAFDEATEPTEDWDSEETEDSEEKVEDSEEKTEESDED